jgi:hypothetical protein
LVQLALEAFYIFLINEEYRERANPTTGLKLLVWFCIMPEPLTKTILRRGPEYLTIFLYEN